MLIKRDAVHRFAYMSLKFKKGFKYKAGTFETSNQSEHVFMDMHEEILESKIGAVEIFRNKFMLNVNGWSGECFCIHVCTLIFLFLMNVLCNHVCMFT